MKLPKRSASHDIADKAIQTFSDVLPPYWVFRPEYPDYGIDGSVEIFDENGYTTGLRFLVQSKGKLKPTAGVVKTSFRRETANYFDSIDLPVMIVRPIVSERKVYFKWFHKCDPYYGGFSEKWVTVSYSKSDLWNPQSGAAIRNEVSAIRSLSGKVLSLPIQCVIDINDPVIGGLKKVELRAELEGAIQKQHGLLTVGESETAIQVSINNEETKFYLPGLASNVLHTRGKPLEMKEFLHDIFLMLAVLLAKRNEFGVACKLILHHSVGSSLAADPKMAFGCASILSRGFRISEAIELVKSLTEIHGFEFSQDIFVLGTRIAPNVSAEETQLIAAFYLWRSELHQQDEEFRSAATASYNGGNVLRGLNQYHSAFTAYMSASRLDTGYCLKDYWWRETASICFELGHYKAASILYYRAVQLSKSEKWLALYADSLMYSGSYEESEQFFQKYVSSNVTDCPAEWKLKLLLLPVIREVSKCDLQQRQVEAAAQKCSTHGILAINEALNHDALCSLAWFNRGVFYSEDDHSDREESLMSFLVAATISRWDLEAWANAFLLSFDFSDEPQLIALIAEMAYSIHGEALVNRLDSQLKQQKTDQEVEQIMTGIRLILNLFPQENEEQLEIRLHKEDGSWESLFAHQSFPLKSRESKDE